MCTRVSTTGVGTTGNASSTLQEPKSDRNGAIHVDCGDHMPLHFVCGAKYFMGHIYAHLQINPHTVTGSRGGGGRICSIARAVTCIFSHCDTHYHCAAKSTTTGFLAAVSCLETVFAEVSYSG